MALGTIKLASDRTKDYVPRQLVYFVQRESDGLIKIGCSKKPLRRFRRLAKVFGCAMTCLGVIPGDFGLERRTHRDFEALRVSGEWFQPGPNLMQFVANSTYALDMEPRRKYPGRAVETSPYLDLVNGNKIVIVGWDEGESED